MRLKCQKKGCGSTRMYEIHVASFVAEQEDDPEMRPENNKLEIMPGSGHFEYRCAVCGTIAWPEPTKLL